MAGRQFHLSPSTYLDAVRAEVPSYDDFQDAVAAATEGISARRVLDLGVGTGETARRVLSHHPEAALVAVDASAEMVRLAGLALPGADVRTARLEDPLPAGPFDLVVSALAVHHLPSERKLDLFRRVVHVLALPGRFVLGDVVVPETAGDALTPLEPGVDLPDPLDDQLRWLAEAGFRPHVAWRRADLAVVSADKQ